MSMHVQACQNMSKHVLVWYEMRKWDKKFPDEKLFLKLQAKKYFAGKKVIMDNS